MLALTWWVDSKDDFLQMNGGAEARVLQGSKFGGERQQNSSRQLRMTGLCRDAVVPRA